METRLPLIVIVGPTASGKTSLAVELAQKFKGEIICADSRTIYKGMNIGTAKPSKKEQQTVPHWGLGLVEPGERFTAADFKKYAEQKIEEIRGRGHVPFLVGGTGLYVDAVLFNYQFGGEADFQLRSQLEKMSLEELHNYCIENNVSLPENKLNKRYVIRAIEQKSTSTKRQVKPISNRIIVGISTDRDILRTRIAARTEQLFENGVVEEATILGKKYGWDSEAMTGNVYPIVHSYLDNEITIEEMIDKNTTLDWRLAKRQLTWLRRNPYIKWLQLDAARVYLEAVLVNE
jgi:tRNA dimethylallyltransferase